MFCHKIILIINAYWHCFHWFMHTCIAFMYAIVAINCRFFNKIHFHQIFLVSWKTRNSQVSYSFAFHWRWAEISLYWIPLIESNNAISIVMPHLLSNISRFLKERMCLVVHSLFEKNNEIRCPGGIIHIKKRIIM